jgi:hypothetical protein
MDLEISPGVKLFNLQLVSGSDGKLRLRAPNAFGSRAATFAPEIVQAVVAAINEEPLANGRFA